MAATGWGEKEKLEEGEEEQDDEEEKQGASVQTHNYI
jgi:hypothetical protein